MLHRAHPEGIVVVGQAAHARLVGVVARAWGRPPFALPPCMDETLLAAEQHEMGMMPWEIAPTLNPTTGWPHAYLELSRTEHLALWRDAGPLMRTQSRYAALLVSRHGVWIFSQYERPAGGSRRARRRGGLSAPRARIPGPRSAPASPMSRNTGRRCDCRPCAARIPSSRSGIVSPSMPATACRYRRGACPPSIGGIACRSRAAKRT